MTISKNGIELKGKDVVTAYFCNYFSPISTTVELESPESLPYAYKDYLPPYENSNMFLAPITFGEFQKVITNLKSGNFLGLDGFSTNILKELGCVIHAPLLHILNTSIPSGIFSEIWKFARVISVHKKGDKTDISNNRPIAFLDMVQYSLNVAKKKILIK